MSCACGASAAERRSDGGRHPGQAEQRLGQVAEGDCEVGSGEAGDRAVQGREVVGMQDDQLGGTAGQRGPAGRVRRLIGDQLTQHPEAGVQDGRPGETHDDPAWAQRQRGLQQLAEADRAGRGRVVGGVLQLFATDLSGLEEDG